MKRPVKITLIALVILFGLVKLIEWVVESKFENLINNNPNRTYNITYDNFDLHTFFKGITLDQVKITPLNNPKGTIVTGTVNYAELSGFAWHKFIFSKNVTADELQFVAPVFELTVRPDSTKKVKPKKVKKDGNSLQALFSDILSRADLNQFQIKNGSVIIHETDSTLRGKFHNINILASNIETDSVQLKHIVPFKLGNLEIAVDSLYYRINSYTKARMGSINYSIADESVQLKEAALEYDKDWVAISKERGLQDDVIGFELNDLSISGLKLSSSFWTQLDIEADNLDINGLTLSLKRNKNLQRPPDVQKPLFKGMVDKIPYNVDFDSITISNTTILYGELSPNKLNTGVIEINAIKGTISKFTTFPERKKEFGAFEAHLTARLNDAADMNIDLKVPYSKDTFTIHTSLRSLDMKALSSSLVPLLGIEIAEGQLHYLDYKMNASFYQSQNSLVMDYENLYLTVYKEEADGSQHKKAFLSSIANAAVRHDNLPKEKGYLKASYTTKRNIYRSPFQHIVAGVLDGAKRIVPGKGIQSMINKETPEEKAEQKADKKEKKKTKKLKKDKA